MAFKVFTRYESANKDKATLRPNGCIYLRDAVLDSLDSDTTTEYATLLFDDKPNKLGIKFTKKPARKISREKSGIAINIKPLLKYYRLDDYEGKHTLEVTIQKDMFVIDLSGLKAGKS